MKWTQSGANLEEFITFTNSFHSTILDTTSKLLDGDIQFDPHTKPTGAHLCITPSCCHTQHIFKWISRGLATRISHICSQQKTFKAGSRVSKNRYAIGMTNKALLTIAAIVRNNFLKRNVAHVSLWMAYHNDSYRHSLILPRRYNEFLISDKMSPEPHRVSPPKTPIYLKEHLIHSKLSNPPPISSFQTCHKLRCKLFSYISYIISTFNSTMEGKILLDLFCK